MNQWWNWALLALYSAVAWQACPPFRKWVLMLAFMGLYSLCQVFPVEKATGYLLVSIVVIMAGLQDLHNRYLHPLWLIPGFLAAVVACGFHPVSAFSRWLGGSLGLLALVFVWKKQMGIADVWVLLLTGISLGEERMLTACMVGCLTGIAYGLLHQDRLIPFVSCLAPGILVAMVPGRTVFSYIMELWIITN